MLLVGSKFPQRDCGLLEARGKPGRAATLRVEVAANWPGDCWCLHHGAHDAFEEELETNQRQLLK